MHFKFFCLKKSLKWFCSNQDPNKFFKLPSLYDSPSIVFILYLRFVEETGLFVLWNFPHSGFGVLFNMFNTPCVYTLIIDVVA